MPESSAYNPESDSFANERTLIRQLCVLTITKKSRFPRRRKFRRFLATVVSVPLGGPPIYKLILNDHSNHTAKGWDLSVSGFANFGDLIRKDRIGPEFGISCTKASEDDLKYFSSQIPKQVKSRLNVDPNSPIRWHLHEDQLRNRILRDLHGTTSYNSYLTKTELNRLSHALELTFS